MHNTECAAGRGTKHAGEKHSLVGPAGYAGEVLQKKEGIVGGAGPNPEEKRGRTSVNLSEGARGKKLRRFSIMSYR